jgi:hypothetical protein
LDEEENNKKRGTEKSRRGSNCSGAVLGRITSVNKFKLGLREFYGISNRSLYWKEGMNITRAETRKKKGVQAYVC